MPYRRTALPLAALALAFIGCNLPLPSLPAPSAAEMTNTPAAIRPTSTIEASVPTATATAAQAPESLPCPQGAQTVDAILATCPAQCELDQINQDFDIVFDEALGFPPYACQGGLDPGDGVNPRLAVYQALRAMKALSFDQPFPWTDETLYAWLQNAIDGIVLADTGVSYCCDPQNRIVLKADLLDQAFYATWYNAQYGVGLDTFVGLIVHEARHAEIGGHTCGTDDQTLQELGSWGVQYYLFTWLAEHSAGWLSAEQKQGAAYHADVALSRICNP
jgi:hypothetical protein